MDIKLFTYFLLLPVINFYGFGESAPAITNVTSTKSRSYLKCMFCNDVDTADSCIEEISCAPGQYCFLDKYSEIIFANGKEINIYKYNAGCRSTAICHIAQCKEKESGFSYNGSNHTTRVRTKRQMIRPVHCSECCTKDRCNLDLCDFKSTGSDATRCYSCKDSLDPTTCTETVFCQDDEMCLLVEEIRINPDQSISTVFQQRCERKQLCKAVHANNILETNETTTETAPSTTTTTTTTTAVPSTTRPTLVEFTPPVMKRLLRSRRSHNLIQLKAECCQGDLCNAFNLHDPNLYKDREAFVDRDHHLISLPDNYECPTTTTRSINFTMPMTTTTTTTTEPTTRQPTTRQSTTSTPTTEMTTREPTTQPETTVTTASMKQTTSTPFLTTTTMPTTTTKPTTTTTIPTTNMPTTNMPTTNTPSKITMPTTTTPTTTTTMPTTTTTMPTTTTTTQTTTTTKPTTTTTTPTTTTTTPTTTTTTPTTTTTTPTTTTTTPTTTTTTPTTTTTAPKPPTSCNLCNGMPIYICEEYFSPMQCDTSEQQYCLNVLVNNKDGSRTLDRKCATEKECKSQWWDQTSDRQECSGYDPTKYVAEYFTCTFCCSSSLCNQNIVPDNLYVPQS